jgi:hypothetical protein
MSTLATMKDQIHSTSTQSEKLEKALEEAKEKALGSKIEFKEFLMLVLRNEEIQ